MGTQVSAEKVATKKKELAQVKKSGFTKFIGDYEQLKYALKDFETESGKTVTVCFNPRQAYVLEDAQGLFEHADYVHEVGKNYEHYESEVRNISIAKVLYEVGDEYVVSELPDADRLGLSLFETKEVISRLLVKLASLYDEDGVYEWVED